MTDQLSFLPMLEQRDTSFEDNERIAEQICDEEFERADGDIVKYVAACVDRFDKELPFPYDLRDDDRVKNEDVVGKCFLCGRDVTAQDVCLVNAVTYTWERKDGTTIEAYECFGSHACREPVVTTCDCTDTAFHAAYLRLTGYTEAEYREKLKQDSPTVYAARVASGIYQEA